MNRYFLENDIHLFYVTARTFPDGIMEEFQKLKSLLPSGENRNYYGISYPAQNGGIIYKAAVEESYAGEAEKYGCSTFIIPRGEYISELLADWRNDVTIIEKTFKKLTAHPQIDSNGFCLEMYLSNNKIRCMVRIDPVHNLKNL